MVDAVDRKRDDTARVVDYSRELCERGEAEALEVQAVEEELRVMTGDLPDLLRGLMSTARSSEGQNS
jgi:hypothetical protein